MNTGSSAQRWQICLTAVALCGLVIAGLAGSDAPSGGLGVARAAENNDAPSQESKPRDGAGDARPQSEQDGTDASEDTPDEPDTDESEEVFVPSEDISEDIDVPFPVDI